MIEVYHLNDKKYVSETVVSWEQVDSRYMDSRMSHDEEKQIAAVTDLFNEGAYMLVARVDTKDLEEAWQKTNHIDTSCQENSGVEAFTNSARSSSVGDVFKDENGKYHVVAGMGFKELTGIVEKKSKLKP